MNQEWLSDGQRVLDQVREKSPLVHCVTNYVTVESCANILLAAGASPIMADDAAEVEEITSLCGALVLNLGTLSSRTIPAMFRAGKRARELGRPIILDPTGAGASRLRTETACSLIDTFRPSIIRGNVSEMKALMAEFRGTDKTGTPFPADTANPVPGTSRAGEAATAAKTTDAAEPVLITAAGAAKPSTGSDAVAKPTDEAEPAILPGEKNAENRRKKRGVDAQSADLVTEANLEESAWAFREFARQFQTVVAVSGAIDLITDGERTCAVSGGDPIMTRVTGCGCMLSALTGACAAVNDDPFIAALAAFAVMNLCGKNAAAQAKTAAGGPMMFRQLLIDNIAALETASLSPNAVIRPL